MDEYLQRLRLKLHKKKTRIFPSKSGCEFLGFYIYPNQRKVKKANVRLFEAKLKAMQLTFKNGLAPLEKISKSIQGWIGHAGDADSYGLRKRLLAKYKFCHA